MHSLGWWGNPRAATCRMRERTVRWGPSMLVLLPPPRTVDAQPQVGHVHETSSDGTHTNCMAAWGGSTQVTWCPSPASSPLYLFQVPWLCAKGRDFFPYLGGVHTSPPVDASVSGSDEATSTAAVGSSVPNIITVSLPPRPAKIPFPPLGVFQSRTPPMA